MNLITDLIKETIRGKSIVRTLFNNRLKDIELQGKILDLGAGKIRPSYYRFLKIKKNSDITTVDIDKSKNPDIIANLEKPIPLESDTYDYALAFNLIEYLYDHGLFFKECNRLLKNKGILLGVSPFISGIQDGPEDKFRYSKSSLTKILQESGFTDIKILGLGYGPFVASYSFVMKFIPKILRPVPLFFFILIDSLLHRISKSYYKKENYPLSYFFTCKKEVAS
jgi:SAM-dependent methyltransferase